MKKIVIIGSGFAGVYVAKQLLKKIKNNASVIMISETNYFLFTPLLHEVATGGISRDNIIQPIKHVFANPLFAFIKDHVSHVDTKKKIVYSSSHQQPYDLLILATGSKIDFHGIKGAEQHTIPLRTLHDAYRIKNQVIHTLALAEQATNPALRKKLLTFFIIGGGPTGVELAGELAEFIKGMLPSHTIKEEEITIILIHRGEHLLPQLPPKFRTQCQKKLTYLNVKVMLNCTVTEVGKDFITDQKGKKHTTGTLFWTAGFSSRTIPLDNKKYPYYRINSFFQVVPHKNILALGDYAFLEINGKRIPMLAQLAVKQAEVAAHNALATLDLSPSLKSYHYRLDGFLISVGQYFGVAGIQNTYFSGFFAWWLWRTIYL